MKPILAVTITVVLSLYSQLLVAGSVNLLSIVKGERPAIKWEAKSQIKADFNGDGKQDLALLGYTGNQVVLALKTDIKPSIQYLNFGIGTGKQAAICELPAKLSTDKLYCKNEDTNEKLIGCRESMNAKALTLRGGDCDSINLYWNHDTNEMVWWRN
jgi:hypothetical protein